VAVCDPFAQPLKIDLETLVDRSSRFGFASLSPHMSLSRSIAFLSRAAELRAIDDQHLCIFLCRLAC
jgi:hypothetical protein